jgi:tetratricopeptide (TPR) repeat protein
VSETDEFLQDESLQKVLADQRELEAGPTPQNPAYALLAAGRLEDAEAVARRLVSDLVIENAALEIGTRVLQLENVASTQDRAALDEQNSPAKNNTQLSLVADALIAHGIALARLKRFETALATLERATTAAGAAGAPDKAAMAALTMIQELEQLSGQTLLSLYEQASAGMAKIRNVKLQRRVIDVARNIMTRFRGNIDPDRALDILLAPPSLQEELMRFEERLIEHVLAQRNGSLSDSASTFPLIQERLTCIIELRPKPSLKKRTTDRRRSQKE